jgi:hypothetical protein
MENLTWLQKMDADIDRSFRIEAAVLALGATTDEAECAQVNACHGGHNIPASEDASEWLHYVRVIAPALANDPDRCR